MKDLAPRKRIGLVAHDNKKQDLIEWARYNRAMLARHDLVATGTTGTLLGRELDLPVTCLQSGPLGGDLQVGAMIADGSIDFLVFFWDPLEPQPHDTDVKSLLRIAVVWNIPVACDRASADFMISSPLMTGSYERRVPDYTAHNDREIPVHEGRDEEVERTQEAAWARDSERDEAAKLVREADWAGAADRAEAADPAEPNSTAGGRS
jgi:methylglyoxal synthase